LLFSYYLNESEVESYFILINKVICGNYLSVDYMIHYGDNSFVENFLPNMYKIALSIKTEIYIKCENILSEYLKFFSEIFTNHTVTLQYCPKDVIIHIMSISLYIIKNPHLTKSEKNYTIITEAFNYLYCYDIFYEVWFYGTFQKRPPIIELLHQNEKILNTILFNLLDAIIFNSVETHWAFPHLLLPLILCNEQIMNRGPGFLYKIQDRR
ncbi:hypothetical protein A3Q56_07627, partial [Intoshia linei]